MPNIEIYLAAKAELDDLEAKWEAYSGNNPDKFRADIAAARARVREMEVALKSVGLLPRTPMEQRDAELDAAFPNAASRQVVLWNGKKYMRRFIPVSESLSGKTVKAWDRFWEELSG